MKFLFTHFIKYHEQWFGQLKRELKNLGHEAVVIDLEPRTAKRFAGADVVMEVNYPRDDAIPKSAVHVVWIQDYMVDTILDYDGRVLPQDIIFTLGHGPQIGVPCETWKNYRGSFLPAVADELFDLPVIEPIWDLSLVGYITEPFVVWEDGRMDVRISMSPLDDIINGVMASYRPLRGELDQWVLTAEMTRQMEEADSDIWEKLPRNPAGFIVHQIARTLDRAAVARMMLEVSDKVTFYGHHWNEWAEFAAHAYPHTEDPVAVFRRTKLNIHNNVFGFALHSRVLEAMAVGGFVMAHWTPYHGMAGQMTECFEPDVHFGEYTQENFVERAKYWLEDENARKRAAAAAKKVVKDKHLWKHRAAQLLKELQ